MMLRRSSTIVVVLALAAVFRSTPTAAQHSLTLDPPRLTIPDAAADGRWAISGLRSAQIARDGGVIIPSGAQIHRFDAAGKHLPVIGRKGRGPGEYSDISGVADCGGALIVTDWITRRLTRVATTPTDVNYPATVTPGITPKRCLGERVVFADRQVQRSGATSMPHLLRRDTLLLLDGTFRLDHFDTLARPLGQASFDGLSQPFGALTLVAANDSAIVMLMTDDSVVHVQPFARRQVRDVVVRGRRPTVVTSTMRAARTAQSEKATPASIWNQSLRDAFASVPWPKTLPLWDRILVDDVSRIWLEEYRSPLDPETTPFRWHVISPSGALVGALELTVSDYLIGIHVGEAVLAHRADDDTESIQFRRIKGW